MSEGFHAPVLEKQVVEGLCGAIYGRIFVDCTCGGGGHAAALIRAGKPARTLIFDRDEEALAHARPLLEALGGPVELVHAPFSDLAPSLRARGIDRIGGVLADLGVSSHQLDTARRGFSFRKAAPLDMRLDTSQGPTAAEFLTGCSEVELRDILRDFGEEPRAGRIARAIVANLPSTTLELADLVSAQIPEKVKRTSKVHPATRTFQAIRIALNDELGELDTLLADAPDLLEPTGRLGIITFHSLEDRRVKRRFVALTKPAPIPRGLPVREDEREPVHFQIPKGFGGGATAQADELEANPRARSARFRLIERKAA